MGSEMCIRDRLETADEMYAACHALLPVDIGVMTAAVADWRPDVCADQKLKKTETGLPDLALRENRDILASLGASDKKPELLIGFAAETHNVKAFARDKLARKNCDWIIANNVALDSGIEGGVMGGDENAATLVSQNNVEAFGQMSKTETAQKLAEHIAGYFNSRKTS